MLYRALFICLPQPNSDCFIITTILTIVAASIIMPAAMVNVVLKARVISMPGVARLTFIYHFNWL